MSDIPPGRYRHYKGKEYTVFGVARHSETEEECVVYRQEYGDHGIWVRPKTMFMETVTVDGKESPRFQRMDSQYGEAAGNIFSYLPKQLPDELAQTNLEGGHVRVIGNK